MKQMKPQEYATMMHTTLLSSVVATEASEVTRLLNLSNIDPGWYLHGRVVVRKDTVSETSDACDLSQGRPTFYTASGSARRRMV